MARKKRRKRSRKKSINFSVITDFFAALFHFVVEYISIIILAVIVVGGGMWFQSYCVHNEAFSIKTVSITKTQYLARKDILKASNIDIGENIFLLKLSAISKRLQSIPRIKRAEVKRVLPNTVSIDIVERKEIAQVRLPFRKRYYLIDAEGCVLPPVLKVPRPELVVIEAQFSSLSKLSVGDFYWNDGVENGLSLIRSIRNHSVLSQEAVVSIQVDHSMSMTIVLKDGIEIKVGKSIEENLPKLTKVKEVLHSEKRSQVRYIDLRFNNVSIQKR